MTVNSFLSYLNLYITVLCIALVLVCCDGGFRLLIARSKHHDQRARGRDVVEISNRLSVIGITVRVTGCQKLAGYFTYNLALKNNRLFFLCEELRIFSVFHDM